MSGRRVFLFSFLLAGVVLAGLLTVLQLRQADSGPGGGPGDGPTGRPAALARTTAHAKSVTGGATWSSTWSATVPGRGAVPERVLGSGRCADLHAWATSRSATPRGTATVAFTLAAPPDSRVLVRSLRLVEGRAIRAPQGRDVECVGAADPLGGRLDRWGQLSVEHPKPLQLSRHVRPGGVTGGVVQAGTTDCSCEWWIEAEVLEDGVPRTVRIDDGGRPFTLAPPVRRIGTPAEDEGQKYGAADIALVRGRPTRGRASGSLSVSAGRLLSRDSQELWMVADRNVPRVGPLTANMDVPGAVCPRVESALLSAGARPAGYDTFGVEFADTGPSPAAGEGTAEGTVADVRLRVAKVERAGSEPTGYGCYPDAWTRRMNADRESTDVDLRREDSEVPVLTAEPVRLYRDVPGVPASGAMFFGVFATGPTDLVFHFTVEVTVRGAGGQRTRFTLDDAGRPFVLAARPDSRSPEDEEHSYLEIGRRVS
ncbi:hypothetical protein [Streptomyces boluensis]|uniref:Uncharacterized protein n=1 Tax=Streptomyces boluensis TaxID=1775135 RepID=A0A964UVU7_9ACTN|nr:hypothetical protein [Streptomyces boluensis]NBE55677.1 hypothetical protein [Streptomyces boluensis]